MPILCPLCLQTVVPGEQFFVYCTRHNVANDPIAYHGEPQDLQKICCPKPGDCNEHVDVWTGVFVAHTGCTFKNPMAGSTTSEVELPTGAMAAVNTPETRLLNAASLVYRDQPAMWYPLALLRAINDDNHAGHLVLLAGPRKVGKSIIATMAMSPDVYTESNTRQFQHYYPQTFVSVGSIGTEFTTGTGVKPAFLGAVNAVAMLQSGQPGAASVPATGRLQAFLRVVFLVGSPPPDAPTFFRRMRRVVTDAIDVFKKIGSAAAGQPELNAVSTAPTVALLDWAGERFFQSDDHEVATIVANVDIIAVVVDATHLAQFGYASDTPDTSDTPNSVRHAGERLTKLDSSKNVCVIVTKLDAVDEQLRGPKGNRYLEELARSEDGKLDRQARKILTGWLEQGKAKNAKGERKLLEYLEAHDTPVFFIKTSNVSGGTLGEPGSGMPQSVGLARFILWVLGRLDEDRSRS